VLSYVVRRALIGCVTLFLASFVVYGLVRAIPGDPTAFEAGGEGGARLSEEQLAELRKTYGLDRHWIVAYASWLGNLLTGDLGTSFRMRRPVATLILEAAGPTLLLSVTSLLLAYCISIPLGLHAAYRFGKADERLSAAVVYLLYSLPSYVVAIYLLLLFGVKLRWLPLSRMYGPNYDDLTTHQKLWDLAAHLVLPVTCYTYGAVAYYTRFLRANLSEVVRQDFIRTARAKGLGEGAILVRHALRSSLVPFVTMVGLSLPALFSGSVILERIFSWPGMGRLFFDAFLYRDYPLVMGLTLTFSLLVVAGTLIADVLCAAVDPRISYD